MKKEVKRSYTLLHIAVILFGMTAILGSLIDLSAIMLVWWRVLITSVSLLFVPVVFRSYKKIPWSTIILFLATGILVALHWITFYGAIKLANASIALICFAVMPFFTGIIEPIINKKPINRIDLMVSLLLIPGMILLVKQIKDAYYIGVIVGLISAALVALFSSITKKHINKSHPITISFLQIFGAFLTITIMLPFVFMIEPNMRFIPIHKDWILLLILSLLCTSFAYVIATYALKHVSAFNSNLIINLEPIYGIILAILFLNENRDLNIHFYLGASLMFVIAIGYPVWKSGKINYWIKKHIK